MRAYGCDFINDDDDDDIIIIIIIVAVVVAGLYTVTGNHLCGFVVLLLDLRKWLSHFIPVLEVFREFYRSLIEFQFIMTMC